MAEGPEKRALAGNSGFPAASAASSPPQGAPDHISRHDPPTIPDHTLLKCIGRGSYGEVWLARNVIGAYRAVKVVYRTAFDHDRPFEREFEGIKKFEPISRTHESQVDVLHVGRNESAGYFYYVMELADDSSAECGMRNAESPLRSAAALNPETYVPKTLKRILHEQGRLPIEQCLRIAIALATAMDHLHQHGLVHRDIKPSNIIFVEDIPKLADIGLIADMDATMSFVGTAGYVPPEGPGTPQADIYSLGKVLYEMSSGRDRQDFPQLPAVWKEFTDQTGLLELNAIILKACESDPRKRYQSGREMLAELALLHSGRSVRDRRALERRLKITTRATVAVVAVMLLGVVPYWWAIKEARRARASEAKASTEAVKSRQVAQFLEDMLASVDPSVAKGRDATMLREILDRTAERIGKELTNQPDVEIELRSVLARTYSELGLWPQTEEMARTNLRLARSHLGEEHTVVADTLYQLGGALMLLGRLDEAATAYKEALTMRRKLLGNEHPSVATSMGDVAFVLRRQGKLTESETMQREALALSRMLRGGEHLEVAIALYRLALVLQSQNKLDEAEAVHREALAMKRKLLGDEHPKVADSLIGLATVLQRAGKLEEAEAMHRETLALQKKLLGDEHETVIEALRGLGFVLRDQGRFSDAETLLREALAMRRQLPGDVYMHSILKELAQVLEAQGKASEAAEIQRQFEEFKAAQARARPANKP